MAPDSCHVLLAHFFALLRFSCPDPSLPTWCGYLRDSNGKLVLDSFGKAQSVCAPAQDASSCPSIPNWASKAIPKTQSVPPYTAATISVTRSDNTTVATLDVASSAIPETTFVISSAPDSVFQAGSFSALFTSGRLRSPLVAISPSGIVDARSGGLTLTLAVDVSVKNCVEATLNMKVSANHHAAS